MERVREVPRAFVDGPLVPWRANGGKETRDMSDTDSR